jgi:hypothetical protein
MFSPALRRLARGVVLPSTLLVARVAAAAEAPTAAELNAAREQFMAAEKDEDAQRWSDALEKLQRVARVKLTSGVRYHTALCKEHLGRLVEAMNDYKAAAAQARTENATDVLRLVDRRIAESTERTPQVVIVLVPSTPEATVLLDGQPIAAGTPLPVDPGTHTIDASASGRTASSATVTVQERDSTRIELRLDPVAPAPVASPPAPVIESPEPARSAVPEPRPPRAPTVTIVAAATAGALAAGGLAAYLVAGSQHSDSVQGCAQIVSTQTDACDAGKNSVRAWDWVGVGAWAGAAVAGAVAIVSLVRSHAGGAGAAPAASLVVAPASMRLEGTF